MGLCGILDKKATAHFSFQFFFQLNFPRLRRRFTEISKTHFCKVSEPWRVPHCAMTANTSSVIHQIIFFSSYELCVDVSEHGVNTALVRQQLDMNSRSRSNMAHGSPYEEHIVVPTRMER